MQFDVVTLFAEEFPGLVSFGVTGRAIERQLIEVRCHNPRKWATDRRGTVDDRPYGGGPGMVMKIEPLRSAIRAARQENCGGHVVCLTPQGAVMTHGTAMRLSRLRGLVLVCGRYEGIDERLIEMEVDEELSVGDYVLSGGELAAAIVIDAVTRQLEGVLGDADSAAQESFVDGILDCPHYTRPESVDGRQVPQVLMQGNHGEIARWRRKQCLGRTWERRPELLEKSELDDAGKALLEEYKRER